MKWERHSPTSGSLEEIISLPLIAQKQLAGKHSYEIARQIAVRARDEGFDGLIYPSYFSELRTGVMPLRTTYGLSNRRIPQYQEIEEALAVPNYAIFGRPIEDGKLVVRCINKMVIGRVDYEFHFGPVGI